MPTGQAVTPWMQGLRGLLEQTNPGWHGETQPPAPLQTLAPHAVPAAALLTESIHVWLPPGPSGHEVTP